MKKETTVFGCPVCGYKDFVPFDSAGFPNYDICPCCSFESGNEYDHRSKESHLIKLRKIWIEELHAQWWKGPAPKNWSYIQQLEDAGLV